MKQEGGKNVKSLTKNNLTKRKNEAKGGKKKKGGKDGSAVEQKRQRNEMMQSQ